MKGKRKSYIKKVLQELKTKSSHSREGTCPTPPILPHHGNVIMVSTQRTLATRKASSQPALENSMVYFHIWNHPCTELLNTRFLSTGNGRESPASLQHVGVSSPAQHCSLWALSRLPWRSWPVMAAHLQEVEQRFLPSAGLLTEINSSTFPSLTFEQLEVDQNRDIIYHHSKPRLQSAQK